MCEIIGGGTDVSGPNPTMFSVFADMFGVGFRLFGVYDFPQKSVLPTRSRDASKLAGKIQSSRKNFTRNAFLLRDLGNLSMQVEGFAQHWRKLQLEQVNR